MSEYLHSKTGLIVIVERDEGGWFVAQVPALPGCVAQGGSLAEVGTEIGYAIEDVLEIVRQDNPQRFDDLMSPYTETQEGPLTEDSTSGIGFRSKTGSAAA